MSAGNGPRNQVDYRVDAIHSRHCLQRFFSDSWGFVEMRIELDREVDGRWIAEMPDLPGVMVYGDSKAEAIRRVKEIAAVRLAK